MLKAIPIAAVLAVSISIPAHAQPGQGVDALWANNCLKCHGDRGQGGGAGTSTLLTDELMDQGLDRRFFDSIKDGMPEQGMDAFGQTMSDPQIWAMVNYIRELQAQDQRRRIGSPRPGGSGAYSSQHHRFRVETVIESDAGLRVPWSIEFLPGGKLLVTNRPGDLRINSTPGPGGKLSAPISGTPGVRNRGQGGMMDVTLHPEHEKNGWVYLAYSDEIRRDGRSLGMTRIVRGRIADIDGAPAWTDEQTIFQARPEHYVPTDLHFGCKIVFDPRDPSLLYFSIGERGLMQHAPDLSRPNGKIHRVRDDGTIPDDNPFAMRDGDSVYRTIWSYGHRNPQGLVFDRDANLWDTEHGPRGGDELNLIVKGIDYGWPEVSFGINYNGAPFKTPWPRKEADLSRPMSEGIGMPAYRWMPSIGACGMGMVRGEAFPKWEGDLLAGGLSGQNVDRVRVREGKLIEREELLHGMGRVRDVECGPDGSVYVVLNDPDIVIRLVPAGEE